jgi:diguanylate cyclase (GGDEF)-like protein
MHFDGLLTAVLVTSAAGYVLLGARLWRAEGAANQRVSRAFLLVAAWLLGELLQLRAGNPYLLQAGRLIHFMGAAFLPLAAFSVFRIYVGKPMARPLLTALCVVPAVSVALAATNAMHGYVWSAGETAGLWLLFVHTPFTYLLLLASIGSLILHSHAVTPNNRRVVLLLAGTVVFFAAALLVYDLGPAPYALAAVPVACTLLLPVFAWLVFREQVVEFSPLAYETVFQNMYDPVVVIDDRQRIIGLNHGAEKLLNVTESEALRASLHSLFGPDMQEVHNALHTGLPQKMLTTSGRFLHLQASPLGGGGRLTPAGQLLMFRDVSDVEKAQQEVRSSEKLLRTLIDHSVNGVVRLRWSTESGCRRLRCVFANRAAGRFLHADPERMLNCTADEIILLACSGMPKDEARAVMQKFMSDTAQGEVVDIETRVEVRSDCKWLRVIGEPVGDNVAVTFVDVTDRKAKELQMESIAWSDPLTGVLNRRGFERDAAHRLSISDDLASGALLFIDLNDFKAINDRCGHEVGDRLLTIAAGRLRKTLRSCDIIGRPGGDEFVALVPDVTAELAESLAGRLTKTLEQTYSIGEAELLCPASIGLALYPQHANTLTGLMRAADQAMYRAKARSRGVTELRQVGLLEKAG